MCVSIGLAVRGMQFALLLRMRICTIGCVRFAYANNQSCLTWVAFPLSHTTRMGIGSVSATSLHLGSFQNSMEVPCGASYPYTISLVFVLQKKNLISCPPQKKNKTFGFSWIYVTLKYIFVLINLNHLV